MPAWYHEYSHRLEHLVSTFARNARQPLNFSTAVSGRLDVLPDELMMQLRLNQDEFSVPNVPRYLKQLRDVKFNALPYYGLEYGLTSE